MQRQWEASQQDADPAPVQAAEKATMSHHYAPTEGRVSAAQQRGWHGAFPFGLEGISHAGKLLHNIEGYRTLQTLQAPAQKVINSMPSSAT